MRLLKTDDIVPDMHTPSPCGCSHAGAGIGFWLADRLMRGPGSPLPQVQKARPDLRVVISSATLEAGALASYFDARTDRRQQAAVPVGDVSRAPALLSVEGRTHDVKVRRCQGAAEW